MGQIPPLRNSTPAEPKGTLLYYFELYIFGSKYPKNFLKAFFAPKLTYYKEEVHAEKNAIFLSKCFKKWLKTPFIACFFFKILPVAQKIGPKQVPLVL